jgi:glycosyltransferase involved in cell wall biosynthesis
MSAADIFTLPSYREGFGSVVIEAAACGLPSVVSNIYGLNDAVVHGKTGLQFDCGSVDSLANALDELVSSKKLRLVYGANALYRVKKLFFKERLTHELMCLYGNLLL